MFRAKICPCSLAFPRFLILSHCDLNSKVIGAKYFNLDNIATGPVTPADDDGHGTHTSSTAAGVAVKGASFYGIAKGTARGGVPSARIAMYKVSKMPSIERAPMPWHMSTISQIQITQC